MPNTSLITPYSEHASSPQGRSSNGHTTFITDLGSRLTSRKFLLAVIAGLSAYERGETTIAVAIAALYVVVEGGVDIVSEKRSRVTEPGL